MYCDYEVLNESYYLIAMPQVWLSIDTKHVIFGICVSMFDWCFLLHKLIVNGFTTVNTGNLPGRP